MQYRDVSKKIAREVAFAFLGKPYIWGGDDPINGFDCSGFVIEIMKSVGLLPRGGDWTAQGLYEYFVTNGASPRKPAEGVLVFWYNSAGDRIIHVEYCLDEMRTIGASGGGSSTDSAEDAARQNAYIKVRPINEMRGKMAYLDPFSTGDVL